MQRAVLAAQVAARVILRERAEEVQRILIVDLDVHQVGWKSAILGMAWWILLVDLDAMNLDGSAHLPTCHIRATALLPSLNTTRECSLSRCIVQAIRHTCLLQSWWSVE